LRIRILESKTAEAFFSAAFAPDPNRLFHPIVDRHFPESLPWQRGPIGSAREARKVQHAVQLINVLSYYKYFNILLSCYLKPNGVLVGDNKLTSRAGSAPGQIYE
jgi:hypothetical protein